MKKLFYILLLLGSTYVFAQNKGMTYQAVIYAPGGQNVPGVNVANVPLTNRTICLQFSLLDASSGLEYQEVVKTKTDEFGMVNITIGSGTQTGGYATSFGAVVWSASADKSMKVALDATGLCNQYEELSVEKLDAVPFANAAITAGNVTGVVALTNGGTGATTAAGARTNLGIGNVDNTSDLNKPMSTATKTYVDSQLTNSTIVDADANTKGKVQLAGDLAGTAAAPTVPGLALKENAANKSTTTTLGTSNVLFPTQNAVKTYVDTAIAGATIVDADANTKGKIQLAGDLAGTAAAPTVPGLALKLDASLAGVPNGIATLNSAGIIPANQLPPISVASTNVVGSQAAMLALSNATVGSIAVRTDVNKNFILSTAGPSVLANWIELLTPGAPVQSVNGLTGAIQLSKADINLANVDNTSDAAKPVSTATQNALSLKLNTNQVGVPNGTASLNALGKIPTDQIPAISFSSVKVLGSQAEMLAQTSALIGSVVIRTDVNKNYVLAQSDPTILANWVELLTPAPPVQTVNGYVGNISLTKADLGLGNVDNTGDINKPVSTATQTALDLKANLASPSFTGTVSGITKSMVGLANVDNTTDLNKPVSTATQTALDLKANLASPSFTGTVSGITKSMVGLANVDNTTDLNKPVSTATQTALDLKANTVDLTAETTRATAAEATLTTNVATNATAIAAETTRATAAEATLTTNVATNATAIAAETTRATAAEATLTTNVATNATAIAAETTRATAAEATLTTNVATNATAIAAETTRATAAEATLTTNVATNATAIAAETTRATAAEATLTTNLATNATAIAAETTRATAAEATLTTNVATNATAIAAETTRATAAEATLTTNVATNATAIAAETTRATAAEATLTTNVATNATAIAAETTRATAAEATLTTNLATNATAIAAETTRATAAEALKANATDVTSSLALKEDAANKTFSVTTDGASDVKFPSAKAVKTYVDTAVSSSSTTAVPYTGATGAVNLGAYDLTVNGLKIGKGNNAVASNTALGSSVLTAVTTGGSSQGTGLTAIGSNALKLNTTGYSNTAVGNNSLTNNREGSSNTAIGADVLKTNQNGNMNTGLGDYSLNMTTGSSNTAIGANSLSKLTTGSDNTAIGYASGMKADNGGSPVDLTTASQGVFIGLGAKANTTTSTNEIVIGYNAVGNGSNSVTIGNASTTNTYLKGNINGGIWNGTEIAIAKGGTGATTAAAALTNLGAEPTANKSTATDLGNSAPSDVLFPSQKAVKAYVDAQTAAAGVSDGSITSAKILDGTIAAIDIADNTITGAKLNSDLYAAGKKFTFQDLLIGAGTTFGKISTDGTKHIAFEPTYNVESTRFWGNGNITIQTGGTFTDNGYKLEVAGTTKFGGNATIAGTVTASSGITGTQFTSTIADGTAPFVVTSTTPVANLSIGGNAATVTTNANLTGDVTSSGNATTIGANKVVTAMIANATITNAKLDKANIPLSGFGAAAADVALGANKLTGVADPTLAQDAATKNYVDTATAGITTLADGKIYLGNASNVATEVTPTGDVTMTNAGVTAIGSGKVVVGMLATDAVETVKIKDANVTEAKLAADAVTSAKILNGTIVVADLAANAVEEAKIKDANVTTAKLADAAVTTAKITDANITTAKLADTAVTTAKITDANVTYAKIQNVSATDKVLGRVTAGAGVVEEIATTGSGNVVRATSPTLVTPTLGVATATSINGLTPTAQTTGFTIAGGTTSKTLTVSADATVSGTNTGDQTITLTGDVTGTGTGSFTTTVGKINGTSLAGLATGILKNTTTTGVPSIAVAADFPTLNQSTTGNAATATTATNIAGGAIGSVPYQSAAGTTALLAGNTTTTAKFLTSTGTGTAATAPTWTTISAVPYTGATGAVDLGAYDLKVNGLTVGKGTLDLGTNTSIGDAALSSISNSTAGSSTAVGYQALNAATTGGQNSALGYQSLNKNTTGIGSVAIGSSALKNAKDANYNVAIGNNAMLGGSITSGYGGDNVAIGTSSLGTITTGASNIALGTFSGGNITSGSKNIFIGDNAGYKAGAGNNGSNTTGRNSVIIGWNARPSADNNTNEVVLSGYNTGDIVGLGSNTTLIGNSATLNTKIWGALNLPDVTASTTSTTGALTVGGGVGVAGALNVGTTATITGSTTISSTTASTSTTTGALKVGGGAGIVGNTYIGGTISIAGGTPGLGKVLTSDANGLATWSNNGGGGVLSKTATYTILTTDNANVLVFSGSTASQTITLPSAVTVGAGREITIKNVASVSVAIASAAGYLISDSTTTNATGLNIGIEPSNNWIKAISDGTNWIILRALF